MRMPVTLFGRAVRVRLLYACVVVGGLLPAQVRALEIEVRGVTVPAPSLLAKALQADDDLLRATAPYVSDEGLCDAAAEKTRLALQRLGYAEPAVQASVERDGEQRRVVLECVPGSQVVAGPVDVRGVPDALAARLTAWLTSPQPPSSATPRIADAGNAHDLQWVNDQGRPVRMDRALWLPGEAAAVDLPFRDDVRRSVARCLREEGYLVAAELIQKKRPQDFSAAVEVSEADGLAHLVLQFGEEPLPATVRNLEVHGVEGLSGVAVLDFLEAEIGSRVSEVERRQWENGLRESGRFIRQRVTLQTDSQSQTDGSVVARVELLAYPQVSPLDQPLTREEQTMLRFRSWLQESLDGDGLVLRLTDASGDDLGACTLSAGHGVMLRVGGEADDAAVVAITDAGFGAYLPHGAGCFEVPLASLGQAVVQASLSVRDTIDPEKGAYRHDLSLGASFGTPSADGDPAAVVSAKVEPVACIGLVHRQATTGENPADLSEVRWDGGTLEIVHGEGLARFDEKTGRLMELRVPDLGRVEISEAGDWGTALAHLRETSGPNAYEPHAPVSSAITFVGLPATQQLVASVTALVGMEQATQQIGPGWQGLASALMSAAAEGGFAKVDKHVANFFAATDKDDLPKIPSPKDDKPAGDPLMLVLGKLSGKAWGWLDSTCGRDAWPTALARLGSAVLRGEATTIFQEVAVFMSSEQAGPVAHLVAASAIPMKPLAASIALRGGNMVTAEAFQRDCAPVLSILDRSGLDLAVVAVARRLEPGQAAALGMSWFGQGDGFAAFVADLRRAESDPSALGAIEESLAAWWEASLGETVSLALQGRSGARIASEPTKLTR